MNAVGQHFVDRDNGIKLFDFTRLKPTAGGYIQARRPILRAGEAALGLIPRAFLRWSRGITNNFNLGAGRGVRAGARTAHRAPPESLQSSRAELLDKEVVGFVKLSECVRNGPEC